MQKAQAFPDAGGKFGKNGFGLPGSVRHNLPQGEQNTDLHCLGDQPGTVGDFVPQGQSETGAERGQAAAKAVDCHQIGLEFFVSPLQPCAFQGIIGQCIPGTRGKIVAQRRKGHGNADAHQAPGEHHNKISHQLHQSADHQHSFPAEHIRHNAGGQLKKQAGNVKHRFGNADFHQAEAPGRQNGNPGTGKGKIAQHSRSIQGRYLFLNFRHKKYSFIENHHRKRR